MYYTDQNIKDSYSDEYIKAMEWIKDKTPKDSTILSSYKEGSLINYEAERKNVVDSNFLTIENIDQRFEDVKTIYTTKLETVAINNIERYDIDYIIISERTKELFNIKKLEYVNNEKCFDLVFDDRLIQIYEPLCKIIK